MVDGQKYDQGKPRFDLFPSEALWAIVNVLTFGAVKYEDRNWEKGIKYGRVFAALQRHLWAWWQGEGKDAESGMSHLWHAGCCIVFLITYEMRGMSKFDDRPKPVTTGVSADHTSSFTLDPIAELHQRRNTTLIKPKEKENGKV